MNPDKIRKVYAPYSTTGEQVGQTPLEGYVDVAQAIYPAVNTGIVDETGTWQGIKSTDTEFFDLQTDKEIANGAEIISNNVIDMQYHDILMIAINVSNAGSFVFELLQAGGPDDEYFNLKPSNTAANPRSTLRTDSATNTFDSILSDTETLGTNNVWTVFKCNDLKGYKIKLKITNSSGGNSDILTAIMRVL